MKTKNNKVPNWIGDKIEKPYEKSNFESLKFFKVEKIMCLHKQCPECHGTGKKGDGTTCFHYISCPCDKCSPK